MHTPLAENTELFGRVLDAVETLRPFDESGQLQCNLPEIVVVGDQSSGKTSVIESLLGLELPTGGNIATRLPLRVQLRNGPEFYAKLTWTGEDGEDVTEDNIGKNDLAGSIRRATEKVTGDDYSIVDVPIQLCVEGPQYSSFTFTDLPGITRVPVGEQPAHIEELTKELILKYISGESKLILCTCPANVDLSTNAALALASQVDQSKSRTLGLITKADCATPTTISQMQDPKKLGQSLNMPLGFFAVRCRTEEERNSGLTLQETRVREAEFFSDASSPFRDIDKSCLGLNALVKRLEMRMKTQVKLQLPNICAQVDRLIKSEEDILSRLTGPADNEQDAARAIESISLRIVRQFQERVECKILDDLSPITAEIHDLNRDYASKVDNLTSGILSDSFLMNVAETSRKVSGRGFIEDQYHLVFEESARSWITESLIEPSIQLADSVCRQAELFLCTLIGIETGCFLQLFDAYRKMVDKFLQTQQAIVKEYIEDVIRCHNELFSLESTVGSDLYTQGQNEWAIISDLYESKIRSNGQNEVAAKGLKNMMMAKGLYANPSAVSSSTSNGDGYPFCFTSTVVQSESDLEWLQKRLEVPGTKESVATQFRVANYSRQVRLVLRELIPRLVRRNILTKVYKDDALFKTFSTHFDELQGGLIALFTQGPDSEAKMVECMKNLSILRGVKSELMKV